MNDLKVGRGEDYGEPRTFVCDRCDFGGGTRGMDRCGRCRGTGSVFRVGGRSWPNTEAGYLAARAILMGAR
jgi:hypothetical protein